MAKYKIYTKSGIKDFDTASVKSYEHGKNGASAGCIFIRLIGLDGRYIYSTADGVKMTRVDGGKEDLVCKA